MKKFDAHSYMCPDGCALDITKEEVMEMHSEADDMGVRLEELGVPFNQEVRDNTKRIPGKNCGYKKEK